MPDNRVSLRIFLPVLLVVAVTLLGFIKMAIEHGKALRGGQNPDFHKVYLGDPAPDRQSAREHRPRVI